MDEAVLLVLERIDQKLDRILYHVSGQAQEDRFRAEMERHKPAMLKVIRDLKTTTRPPTATLADDDPPEEALG